MLQNILDAVDKVARPARWADEASEKSGSFRLAQWPFVGWPAAKKYRVVVDENYDFHKLRLQAMKGNDWVEVLTYDDGYDDYGKLHSAKWLPLSEQCAWTKDQLERIAREALGITVSATVISEISR